MNKDIPVAVTCITTDVHVEETSFMWKINNFSYIAKYRGEQFYSPKFFMAENDLEWSLDLYPYGITKKDSDYVSLYLKLNYAFQEPIPAQYRFSILNSKGEISYQRGWSQNINFHEYEIWGMPQFIKRTDLYGNVENLLPNDILTLYCEVKAFIGYSNNRFQKNIPPQINNSLNQSTDLKFLYNEAMHSNLTISVNKKKFLVHKTILSTISPVFHNILKKENSSNNIELNITEFHNTVIANVLCYTYLQEVSKFHWLGKEILRAAVHFDLGGLKDMCENNFINGLTISNVIDILIVADTYQLNRLRTKAIQFIALFEDKIMGTSAYQLLKTTHPHLLPDIIKQMATGTNPHPPQETYKRKHASDDYNNSSNDLSKKVKTEVPITDSFLHYRNCMQ